MPSIRARASILAPILASGALIAVSWPSLAAAQQTTEPRQRIDESARVHMLGLRFDYGSGAMAFGVYYLHSWQNISTSGGLGAIGYGGVGVDLRLFVGGGQAGVVLGPIVRAGGVTDAMGLSTELSLGVATDGARVLPAVSGGLFYSFYYGDLGASFVALPEISDRPRWLPIGYGSARVQIPLRTYDRRRTVTDLPPS
jgi:hypothetical protein